MSSIQRTYDCLDYPIILYLYADNTLLKYSSILGKTIGITRVTTQLKVQRTTTTLAVLGFGKNLMKEADKLRETMGIETQ